MILWCLGFDITVLYKPGTKIPVADALSRVCLPASAIEESRQCEVNFVTGIESPIDVHRIKDETHHDSTLNMLKDSLQRLAESTEAVSTGTLGLLELQMRFSH